MSPLPRQTAPYDLTRNVCISAVPGHRLESSDLRFLSYLLFKKSDLLCFAPSPYAIGREPRMRM